MASITPSTPICEPTPEMVNTIRHWMSAVQLRDEVYARCGALSREYELAETNRAEAWRAAEAAFPPVLGWHWIEGRWWGKSKVSKFGLELVYRATLPVGLTQGVRA